MADTIKKNFPHVPDRISGLIDLAYNLWWSWNPDEKMVFKQLNPHAWIRNIHNPVKMLLDIPEETLIAASKNPLYLRHYDLAISRFRHELNQKNRWYTEQFSNDRSLRHRLFFCRIWPAALPPILCGRAWFSRRRSPERVQRPRFAARCGWFHVLGGISSPAYWT